MKSWWIRTQGERMVFEQRDVPVPTPKAGEILVRVHASSMNRGELIAGHGLLSGTEAQPAGSEAAGTVEAVGEGVTDVKAGDRIMGRGRGGFSEYAVLAAYQAIPLPPRLTFEQGAAIPLVFMTAYDLLWTCGALQADEWLLVTGVSSGVGVACTQSAKAIGAKVIGTSGSAEKLAKLKVLGLDAGIRTRQPDFAAAVKEATGGRGANLAVNCVGGTVFPECLRALAYQGRLGIVGYVDGVVRSEIDLELVHAQRLQVYGVSNKNATAAMRARTVRGFVRDLLPAFADGRITPVVDRVYRFGEVPAAQQHMESDVHLGKIVVQV
jgi:NADPH:quinone reductase-like Zn-dependent oxidoreductase